MAGLADGACFRDDERLPGVSAFGSLEGPIGWLQGYQSKGARPGEWLGPDLADVMAVAAKNGYDAVVVAPIGFAIDHMETLWDLDIDARTQAEEQGLLFMRTRVPNGDQRFIEALTWAVEPLLSAGSGPD
jgi:ferrochelatase